MTRIRVLVVDDSAVVRKLVKDALAEDPMIEVVGTAANGRIALAKLPQLAPDLVTLDIEMPELDGIATLIELRKVAPKLPVVMFSTLTERGAAATLEALAHGASDYVSKPSDTGGFEAARRRVRDELVPRIKELCRRPEAKFPSPRSALSDTGGSSRSGSPSDVMRRPPVSIVALGSSTGGPNALQSVLTALPSDLGVPLVLVQHMPPMFTRLMAERLDRDCGIAVREARDGDALEPGVLHIAPGDHHMRIARRGARHVLTLDQGPQENSCRPAVDVLFRSAAETFGGEVLAVVLTGMGQDGLRGCRSLAELGAQILVQDQATSVVWGMPGFVAGAGLADSELPVDQIGAEIVRRVRARPRLAPTVQKS